MLTAGSQGGQPAVVAGPVRHETKRWALLIARL